MYITQAIYKTNYESPSMNIRQASYTSFTSPLDLEQRRHPVLNHKDTLTSAMVAIIDLLVI